MSLKELGNQAFKEQRYSQAIAYYDQYVQQSHPDNKNAFFNLGLCYSKLRQHQKSIEACRSALVLDPHYHKAYYRLMKEYAELGVPYEVFINALHFLRNGGDEQSAQGEEARHFLRVYRERFVGGTREKVKKRGEEDGIFSLVAHLQPRIEDNQAFNQQIDKYPAEWIEEWNQDVQSEDAKWEEIAYIVRDVDYHYGISLAYYYLNQQGNKEQKRAIREKIRQIKVKMGREGEEGEGKEGEEEDWVAEGGQGKESRSEQAKPRKVEQNTKEDQGESTRIEKTNKIQQMLQKKSQYRKKLVEPQDIPEPKPIPKPTITPQVSVPTQNPPAKPQPSPPVPAPPAKTAQQTLQQLYKHFCSNLDKPKDIFTEFYRSLFSILSSSHPPPTKGSLLILLKKRIKKFKVIASSLSINEQTAVLDLLQKNGIEQYSVDFAPALHKD